MTSKVQKRSHAEFPKFQDLHTLWENWGWVFSWAHWLAAVQIDAGHSWIFAFLQSHGAILPGCFSTQRCRPTARCALGRCSNLWRSNGNGRPQRQPSDQCFPSWRPLQRMLTQAKPKSIELAKHNLLMGFQRVLTRHRLRVASVCDIFLTQCTMTISTFICRYTCGPKY